MGRFHRSLYFSGTIPNYQFKTVLGWWYRIFIFLTRKSVVKVARNSNVTRRKTKISCWPFRFALRCRFLTKIGETP
jgi:hypothetical protein